MSSYSFYLTLTRKMKQGKNVKPSDESRNFLKLLEQDSFIHSLTFFIHGSARLTFKVFKQFQ